MLEKFQVLDDGSYPALRQWLVSVACDCQTSRLGLPSYCLRLCPVIIVLLFVLQWKLSFCGHSTGIVRSNMDLLMVGEGLVTF